MIWNAKFKIFKNGVILYLFAITADEVSGSEHAKSVPAENALRRPVAHHIPLHIVQSVHQSPVTNYPEYKGKGRKDFEGSRQTNQLDFSFPIESRQV